MNKTTEALKLAEAMAKRYGVRMCDENGDTHGEELYCVGIDDIADIIREALAEPVKQEPVAVISESAIGLVKLHSNGACLPFGTQLYAAPVSTEAIRAEALEEAAKWFEGKVGQADLRDIAAAIREMK